MSTETLQNLAAYMIQIAGIALIAELVLRVVRVTAAGFRYAYWRLVLVAALVAPWMLRRAPAPVSDIAAAPMAVVEPSGGMLDVPLAPAEWTAGAQAWGDVLPWLFVAGVAVRLVWIAAGLMRLRSLRRAGVRVEDPAYEEIQQRLGTGADVRAIPGLAQPVTFGALRPVVLLPADLAPSEDLRRAVVTHELVHVLRRDWLAVLAEELLRTVLWFHPAIWWLTSRVRLAREEFTDHLAVLATGSRRAYVEALLAFSESSPLDPAPAFARRAHLFQRIVTLSKGAAMSSRRIVASGAIVTALLAAGSWLVNDTFPLVKAPVLRAATLEGAQSPGAAGEQVNSVTPENPIPRRLSSTPIPYPAELAGSGYVAAVEIVVVLNRGGSVTSATRATVATALQEPRAPGVPESTVVSQQAMDAFVDTAIAAIRQWQYDPPVNAPLRFYVAATFREGQAATVSQSDIGRGVVAGRGTARLATAVDRAEFVAMARQNGQPSAGTAPASASAVRVGGNTRAPVQTRRVNPEYPAIALSARVQGVVIVELVIDEQGKVAEARILRSIPLLDQAALDAVRQWEYTPTMQDGAPVRVTMTATVRFTLPPG